MRFSSTVSILVWVPHVLSLSEVVYGNELERKEGNHRQSRGSLRANTKWPNALSVYKEDNEFWSRFLQDEIGSLSLVTNPPSLSPATGQPTPSPTPGPTSASTPTQTPSPTPAPTPMPTPLPTLPPTPVPGTTPAPSPAPGSGFPAAFNLTDLDGTNGFVINGIEAADRAGDRVSGTGDVNGDGIGDFLVGGQLAADAGEVYVIFGTDSGFDPAFNLSSLDGSNGFTLNGIDNGDFAGISIAGAGDVNGDGFDDSIVGAWRGDRNGQDTGEAYVVFGKASGFDPELDLSDLDGSNGFILNGVDSGDFAGISVGGAVDVNGDGFDDVIIGADGVDDGTGAAYVVFGKASGFDPELDLSTLDGTNGFTISGFGSGDQKGYSVAGAGDVNGDGFDDVIIGAPTANVIGISNAGEAYIVFGKASGFSPELELSTLDGSNGFTLLGFDTNDQVGFSVAGAGDVNSDGFDDVIVGTNSAGPNGINRAGQAYVVFGKASGFSSNLLLSTLDGSNGFSLDGTDAFDQAGYSVAGAGDVNSDGFDDVIIGARSASPNDVLFAGEAYVVFGKASGFNPALDLSTLDGSNGFTLNGVDSGDETGFAVAGVGDVNGDGIADVIVGTNGADANGKFDAGRSYVVFGQAS